MDIKKIIKNNPLQAFGLAITLLNLLGAAFLIAVSYQLRPLYEGQTLIIKRVEAVEGWKMDVTPDIKRIPVIESKIDTIKEDIKDIKSVLGVI